MSVLGAAKRVRGVQPQYKKTKTLAFKNVVPCDQQDSTQNRLTKKKQAFKYLFNTGEQREGGLTQAFLGEGMDLKKQENVFT